LKILSAVELGIPKNVIYPSMDSATTERNDALRSGNTGREIGYVQTLSAKTNRGRRGGVRVFSAFASGEVRRFHPYTIYVKPDLQTRCGFEAALALDAGHPIPGVRRK
jgi:hypothetical protein